MNAWSPKFENYKSRFVGDVLVDEPLSKHTYYRIGGPADLLIIPREESDLEILGEFFRNERPPLYFLGAGSNTLAADAGFRGVVVKTTKMNSAISAHENTLHIGASVLVSMLLRRASQEGWSGLAFLAGIPGTLGGVATMNGGTLSGEFKDTVSSVRAFNLDSGKWTNFTGEALKFSYRKNHFIGETNIIFSVDLKITLNDPSVVKGELDSLLLRRKQTQPVDLPSCGSVFKNPKNASITSAWAVMDKLGLRGHQVGGAQFSPKHCNFIVNLGGAKSADVRALINLAKSRALTELQITLEEEVRYLG